MNRFHPFPTPVIRRAMTLVEVMIAFAVFAIAVVGGLSAIIFSLNNVDSARTEAQVTQILVNEMEAMRLRLWDQPKDLGAGIPQLFGIKNLTTVTPMPAAPEGPPAPPSLPATVTKTIEQYIGGGTIPSSSAITLYKTTFLPFAVYGVAPTGGKQSAQIGKEVSSSAPLLIRNTNGYTCERYIGTFTGPATANKEAAVIILRVSWTDRRGNHERNFSTIFTSNGLLTQH